MSTPASPTPQQIRQFHAECTVQRQTVRLHNRVFFAEALGLHEAAKVDVQYELHQNDAVSIFDKTGGFICKANRIRPISPLTSAQQESRSKRLEFHIKRMADRADPI